MMRQTYTWVRICLTRIGSFWLQYAWVKDEWEPNESERRAMIMISSNAEPNESERQAVIIISDNEEPKKEKSKQR